MEESTPLTNAQTDTSDVELNDTSGASTEPENNASEPASADAKADTDSAPQSEQLIFGKYKTMADAEKGYKEAERAITKASDLEKQLKAYQEREQQAREQREIAAREDGFADADEQEVRYNVANYEFKQYCAALGATLTGESYNKALGFLQNYQNTGNPQYLEAAKSFFSAGTISKIAANVAMFENGEVNNYRAHKAEAQAQAYKQQLESFARENTDWIAPKERQDAIGLLIQLSGGNVDFAEAKRIIDGLEAQAVEVYKKNQAEHAENSAAQNSLQTPGTGGVQSSQKWFTKEDYYNMTPEQEAANYDKIVQQIELEKQGKLPRQLT